MSREVSNTPTEPDYTDKDLLNQIWSECDTAIQLGALDRLGVTLAEGFMRKIDSHLRGEKWWEAEE